MGEITSPQVAIVDFGMGNLFSIKQACKHADLQVKITSSKNELLKSDAIILPGVGAFGDAMARLQKLDLVTPIQEFARSKKLIVGICLGMQLLMTESHEFGHFKGLGIVEGTVTPFPGQVNSSRRLKIPHIGWNKIFSTEQNSDFYNLGKNVLSNSPFAGLSKNEFMYFSHSFFVKPEDSSLILSTTNYGGIEFCSSLIFDNIFACQFHPERSGFQGLKIYQNLSSLIGKQDNH